MFSVTANFIHTGLSYFRCFKNYFPAKMLPIPLIHCQNLASKYDFSDTKSIKIKLTIINKDLLRILVSTKEESDNWNPYTNI